MTYSKAATERFWSKVNKTDGCWLWTGSTISTDYGALKMDGMRRYAHRASYELSVGPIPDGFLIDHKCGTPRCVNPAHLRLATPKQNAENHRGHSDSKLGVRGVSWSKRFRKYVATVQHFQKRHYVGSFHTLAEAEAAVIAKRNELFTHNDMDRMVTQ